MQIAIQCGGGCGWTFDNVDAYNEGVIVVHAIAVTLVVFGLCTAIEVFRTKIKNHFNLTSRV